MELDGPQRAQLVDALISAFPKLTDLEVMVSLELNENLDTITTSNDLRYAAFKLTTWAEASGILEDLIIAARRQNNGNPKLLSIAETLGLTQDRSISLQSQTAMLDKEGDKPISDILKQPLRQPVKSATAKSSDVQAQPTSICNIIPLGSALLTQPVPAGISVIKGYCYLGKLDTLLTDHLYREKDGHIALLVEQRNALRSYVIDKYTITNQQFCLFLNDLLKQRLAYIDPTAYLGMPCCVSHSRHVLVADARKYWGNTPNPHNEHPWGVTQQDGQWQPVDGCALLPATLVTWWGAQFYAQWVHNLSLLTSSVTCLPTQQQWRRAALFDPRARKERAYPWGEEWQRQIVNYAGYWAGKEIRSQMDWQCWQAQDPTVHKSTRPLPVAELAKGCSSIGCVQLIGNVWEWCADVSPDNPAKRTIKGGACNSPQEYCRPDYQTSWQSERVSEYIGFRCAYAL